MPPRWTMKLFLIGFGQLNGNHVQKFCCLFKFLREIVLYSVEKCRYVSFFAYFEYYLIEPCDELLALNLKDFESFLVVFRFFIARKMLCLDLCICGLIVNGRFSVHIGKLVCK